MRLRKDSAVYQTARAVADVLRARRVEIPLRHDERLDGRTALVTGGNRGLGRAIALRLARRGARVLLACRSGLPDAARRIAMEARGADVVPEPVDLADLSSVAELARRLVDREERVDVLVLNAAVVPSAYRRTRQGLEVMFGVNYLANVALVRDLVPGVLGPGARVIVVSSDSHRAAGPIDVADLERVRGYGATGVMPQYEHGKLLLQTWAAELSRRHPELVVRSACPGPVHTDIAREAPAWVKPVLVPLMATFFQSPMAAAAPFVAMACARDVDRLPPYLHMTLGKAPAPSSLDPALGAAVWDASHALIRRLDPARSRT